MVQKQKGVYVRIPQRDEDFKNPRDFLCGQVIETDETLSQTTVRINDPYSYGKYYGELFQPTMVYPSDAVSRCALYEDTKVKVKGTPFFENFTILSLVSAGEANQYLLQSEMTGKTRTVPETEIIAPFNNGKVSPTWQLKNYELQNPSWFQQRFKVQLSMNYLNNLMYGFKEVAGAKINLLPHQLQVIMRCLSEQPMRFMLADEVGMGKTIEALAVLRAWMHSRRSQNILILVPDPLKEQWRIEMLESVRSFV